MDLASHWPLTTGLAVRDELIAAYGSAARGYHDQRHLNEVFERLTELAEFGEFDHVPVFLAAWFHDGVYDGHADAEERSAQWAARALAAVSVAPELVAEVVRLVRITVDHRAQPGDANAAALSDADLAILASSPERYAEYCDDVRREYAHISEILFRKGRTAILSDLLAKPTIFHTAHAVEVWETLARTNVEAEIRHLAE